MSNVKNIGGAFSLLDTEPFILKELGDFNLFFPEQLNGSKRLSFESGIDALAHIVKDIFEEYGAKALFFPLHYCQDSIDRLIQKVPDLSVKRYSGIEELLSQKGNDIVLWNHFNKYYDVPQELLGKETLLIEDFVQAPLDMAKAKAAYSLNSLRKLCNLEVAVCYSKHEPETDTGIQPTDSPYYLSKKKAEVSKHYFQKTGDTVLEEYFLEEFKQVEELLKDATIYQANLLEAIKFEHLDFSTVLKLRKENYRFVKANLPVSDKFNIVEGDYMYLMLEIKERDKVRKYLAQNGVFTTVHWLDSADIEKANSYLTLYIDQRYTNDDLARLVQLFKTIHAD